MGRGRGQWRDRQQYAGWQSSQYGQYSHAWSKEDWRHEAGADRTKELVFPSYSKINIARKSPEREQMPKEREDLDGTGDFVCHVQKLVNAARKAEAKVRKAERESEETETQWKEFTVQLRKAFLKERTKYQGESRRLAQEVDEQRDLHQKALKELRRILDEPAERHRKATDEIEAGALDEWAKLTELPDETADFLGALGVEEGNPLSNQAKRKLAKIMGIRMPAPEAKGPMPVRAARVEAMEISEDEAEEKPSMERPPPYPFSPSTRKAVPSPPSASRSRPPTKRVPVKALGRVKPPVAKPGTRLAEKLERKRAQAVNLMEDDEEGEEEDLAEISHPSDIVE